MLRLALSLWLILAASTAGWSQTLGEDGPFVPSQAVPQLWLHFADDLESALPLFSADRWHNTQITGGTVARDSTRAHAGTWAIKTTTPASGSTQKASIVRQLLWFGPGSDFWVSAWFYIEGAQSTENLFLFDLESANDGSFVGRRLQMTGGTGQYVVLESKSGCCGPNYNQASTAFPRDQWVRLKMHLRLATDASGVIEVWQGAVKIIDATGALMPGAGVAYDWVEIGQSANSSTLAHTVYVDDVVISTEDIP